MNILLHCHDRFMAESLARSMLREGDLLTAAESLENGFQRMSEIDFDVVIVTDQLAGSLGLSAYMEQVQVLCGSITGICLLSNPYHLREANQRMKECLAEGWLVVPPGLSTKQIAARLKQLIYPEMNEAQAEPSRLIHFLGSTPNIGTTVAAYGTAAAMSVLTSRSVGYLCLNLKSSKLHRYLGLEQPPVTLEGLRPELKAGHLNADRLRRQCQAVREFPNLHVLYGNLQREQAEYYSVEEINRLLTAATNAFDYCIVDTSAYWDNAATIGAMTHAGMHIMVTTPNLGDFQEDLLRWCKSLSPVFGLAPDHFDLLITQADHDPLFRLKEIAADAGMQRIGSIRRDEGLCRQLSEGRLATYLKGEQGMASDLVQLAHTLLTLHGESSLPKTKQHDLWAFWRKRWPGGRRMGFAGR